MKSIFFGSLFCLLINSSLQAQEIPVQDDFEGNGTIDQWIGSNCNINTNFANPEPEGINTSATVMRYQDVGGQYAHTFFDLPGNLDLSVNHTFTLKIYLPSDGVTGSQPNQISLKLQNGDFFQPWNHQTEIIKPLITDAWQTISFDFENDDFINLNPLGEDPVERVDFNRVLIQINGENNTDFVLAFIDDFAYDGTIDPSNNPIGTIYTELVWSDEFQIDGAVDASKWHHQTLLPNGNSWFNNEVQHYTDREINSYVDDGSLHIAAKSENYIDQGVLKNFTSARLNSKFAFTYGYVEVRAKLPISLGTWPAIWMLGKNITEPGGYFTEEFGTTPWPACGEIDIMEHWGYNQNFVQSALHTPSSSGATANYAGVAMEDVANNYHLYGMEWTPEAIKFSVDGTIFYIYEPNEQNPETWPFTEDQYILLNIAMQGEIDPNFTQEEMVIDYVRVYQESTVSAFERSDEIGIKAYPNPNSGIVNLNISENLIGSSLQIYSIQGREMGYYEIQDSKMRLDLSEFPSGVYFIKTSKGKSLKLVLN